jgi:hypothetical protein
MATAAGASPEPSAPTLLIIGATGVTGRAALDGLLAAGVPASAMLALTRSRSGAGARAVAERGIPLAEGDLDGGGDEGGGAVASLLARHPTLRAVYVHALSADAATADPRELERAERLSAQLAKAAAAAPSGRQQQQQQPPRRRRLDIVLYNSAAGRGAGSGVSQIEQKHAVEDALARSGAPVCALQASMFYEELWKKYTRPAILERGAFAFSIPPDVPVHLVAARDLGTAVAAALRDPERFAALGALPLAGDALTPAQMCDAFSRAAREAAAAAAAASSSSSSSSDAANKATIATTVTQRRFPPLWLVWLLNKDLYRIVRFLSKPPGYGVDVAAARRAVPGLLTFDEFLRATGWADPARTYEQGVRYDGGPGGGGGGGGGRGLAAGAGEAAAVPVAASKASAGGDS